MLEALTDTPLWSHRALTAKLGEIIAARFGARFMDPPDGGDVPIHDQVERMADALLTLESARSAEPVAWLHEHDNHVREVCFYRLAEGDIGYGWRETPLYAASTPSPSPEQPETSG